MGQFVDSHKTFTDMSGGLNADASTYTMGDDESPDLRNVRTDPLGPVKGRLGVSRANLSTGYGAPDGSGNMTGAAINKPVKSLFRYYKQNGSHLLLFTLDNYLCKISALTGNHDAVNIPLQGSAANTAGLPVADKNWSMATYRDWVYLTTEDSVPYRTNGTGLYKVGEAPTESLTVTAVAGGALPVATYRYVFTRVYQDNLGESPISGEFSATTAGPNLQIQVTLPAAPASRPDITAYRVYRTLSTGATGGPYYFVAQAAPSAVFTDNTADNSLTVRVDTSKIAPHQAAFLTVHQNRIWLGKLTEVSGTVRRFFEIMPSRANRPDEFISDVAYAARNDHGEVLTGMFSYNGVLYGTTLNFLFPVVGSGLERGPFINIPDYRVASPIKGPGALNPRVIKQRNGAVFMTNKVDVWRIKGREIKPLSEFRLRKFLDANLNRQQIEAGAAVTTREHYRVSFAVGGGSRPSMTLIYDFQSNAFLVDDGASFISFAYLDGDSDNLSLYAGEGTDKSYLYLLDSGNLDWDPAAVAYKNIRRRWRSKDISYGPVGQTAQPRILIVEGRQTGARVALNLYVNNNQATLGLGFIEFVQGSTTWGAFLWGDAAWATASQGVQSRRIHVPQTAKGERLSWEFVQEEDAGPFQIDMVTLTGHKEPGVRGAGDAS